MNAVELRSLGLVLLALPVYLLVRVLRSRTRALRRLQEQQQLILNSAGDPLIGTNREGVITFANQAAARLLRRSAPELIGQALHHCLRPLSRGRQALEASLWPALQTMNDGEVRHVAQEYFQLPSGELLPVEYDCTALRNPQGEIAGVVLAFREFVAPLEVGALQTQFISMVGGELRTPLHLVHESLDLLASGQFGQLTQQGKRMLEIANGNAQRLMAIMNEMLEFERLRSGNSSLELQVCQAQALVERAVDRILRPALQNRVQIKTEIDDYEFLADSRAIEQVLVNLLNNALKYSPTESTIYVTARRMGREAELRVTDQGPGIPADMLESIFEHFRQVDTSDTRQQGGTGLGLPICRGIVSQHGGRIWAESRLGEGSTFIVRVPLRLASALGA